MGNWHDHRIVIVCFLFFSFTSYYSSHRWFFSKTFGRYTKKTIEFQTLSFHGVYQPVVNGRWMVLDDSKKNWWPLYSDSPIQNTSTLQLSSNKNNPNVIRFGIDITMLFTQKFDGQKKRNFSEEKRVMKMYRSGLRLLQIDDSFLLHLLTIFGLDAVCIHCSPCTTSTYQNRLIIVNWKHVPQNDQPPLIYMARNNDFRIIKW